jgi:hypothetical protein
MPTTGTHTSQNDRNDRKGYKQFSNYWGDLRRWFTPECLKQTHEVEELPHVKPWQIKRHGGM